MDSTIEEELALLRTGLRRAREQIDRLEDDHLATQRQLYTAARNQAVLNIAVFCILLMLLWHIFHTQ